MKKIIALILAFLMLASLLTVFIASAEEENVNTTKIVKDLSDDELLSLFKETVKELKERNVASFSTELEKLRENDVIDSIVDFTSTQVERGSNILDKIIEEFDAEDINENTQISNLGDHEKLDYKKYARNPEKFKDTKFVIKAKVKEIVEEGDTIYYRLKSFKYPNSIWVKQDFTMESKVLKNDKITVYVIPCNKKYKDLFLFSIEENTPVMVK